MSHQYRVRVKSGKIIGPLEIQDIAIAINSNQFKTSAEFQIYPTGEWGKIENFSEIIEYLAGEHQLDQNKERTILLKIEQLLNSENGKTDEEKSSIAENKVEQPIFEKVPEAEVLEEEVSEGKEEPLPEMNIDPDSTQFINLKDFKSEETLAASEEESILKQEKIVEIERKKKQIEQIKEVDREYDDDEPEEDNSKRKKIVVFAIVAALVIILFMPEKPKEVKKEFQAVKFAFDFPIESPKRNLEESDRLYKLGLQSLSAKTYVGMVNASKYFLNSVEVNYKDNPALQKMILNYVDLMPYTEEIRQSSGVVFQLIQIFYQKYFSDVDVNNAHGMFFYHIERFDTAYKVMKSFLERGNNPTLRYFADLIRICIKSGRFTEAAELYEKLTAQKMNDPYIFAALYEYEMVNNNSKNAIGWLKQGLDQTPTSISLLLKKADFDLYTQDYVSLEISLGIILENLFGSSEYYRAKYYEYMGILSSISGKNAEAITYFKNAEAWKNRSSLYVRIASLDEEKIPEAKDLIAKARAHQFSQASLKNLSENNMHLALLNATNAIDSSPRYPQAVIALAMVEKRMGYYHKAISRLENLQEVNPRDPDVNFTLLETYVDAYKFSDAIKLFNVIGATPLRNHYKFYSINGLMNFNMNKLNDAVQNYQMALEKNPLNDRDYYYLGEILFKRKSFGNAKSAYNKAIELNPSETLYRVAYSKILYEESGTDVAIGYLRDQMRDFKSDPLLMGEIAILYYQSGQVAYFESVQDEIKQLPKKNKRLYEFLIRYSKLNERFDDVIKYSKELLEMEPGDIPSRMFLAELLLELGKYDDALEHLFFIKDRLDTYPKLLYNISRLNLLVGKKDEALTYAKKEVEYNPGLIDGHILLGNILKDDNKLVEAEERFRESLRINPNSVDGLSGLAFVNVKRNNLDAALDMYQKAIGLAPNNPNIRKSIADVYRLTGQSALAIDNYKVYLELVPETTFKTEIETYMRNFE